MYGRMQIKPGIQAWIAQLVAHQLGTTEVVGSNPGQGEDFSKKYEFDPAMVVVVVVVVVVLFTIS